MFKHRISPGSHPKIRIHQLNWHLCRRIDRKLIRHNLFDRSSLMFKHKICKIKSRITRGICVKLKTERCWWLLKRQGNTRQYRVNWNYRILTINYKLSWLVTNIWYTNRRSILWVILDGHQCHQWLEFHLAV